LAIELRPSVEFFRASLANLDGNIKNKKSKNADTLFVIDTGYLPKITPLKINQTFNIGSGPKFITMTFPVIEQSSELFRPNFIEVAGQAIRPELASSIDGMARKNLKDDMPAYVLRATSRALISLTAQVAADQAMQQRNRKNNENNAMAGALAGLITAAAFFDLVAFDWLDQFCKLLQSPLYTVLTYNGKERWLPEDPRDTEILKAFHSHQARDKGGT
jgi:hypothetical protein